MPQAIKIAILENNKYARLGMAQELDSGAYLEGMDIELLGGTDLKGTDSPAELLNWVELHHPDVIIVDLMIGGSTEASLDAIRRAKAISPETKCIVMTGYGDDKNLAACLALGVEIFAVKDDQDIGEQGTLDQLVKLAYKGGRFYHPESVLKLFETIYSDGHRTTLITEKEKTILLLVAERCNNAQIAERIGLTESTVKNHLHNVMSKLRARDRYEAVGIALSKGLITNVDSRVPESFQED